MDGKYLTRGNKSIRDKESIRGRTSVCKRLSKKLGEPVKEPEKIHPERWE